MVPGRAIGFFPQRKVERIYDPYCPTSFLMPNFQLPTLTSGSWKLEASLDLYPNTVLEELLHSKFRMDGWMDG